MAVIVPEDGEFFGIGAMLVCVKVKWWVGGPMAIRGTTLKVVPNVKTKNQQK